MKEINRGIHFPLSKGLKGAFADDDQLRTPVLVSGGKDKLLGIKPSTRKLYLRVDTGKREDKQRQAKKRENNVDLFDDVAIADCDELNIQTRILLREDYLRRLRIECLPFVATSPKRKLEGIERHQVEQPDIKKIAHLIDMIRVATVDVVEAIQSYSLRNNGSPYIWNGCNYLLGIPSDLQFANHIPELSDLLGIKTLDRNPFILPDPLPLPHSTNQLDVTSVDRKHHRCLEDVNRINRATRVILEEEEKHGISPPRSLVASWKELEEQSQLHYVKLQRDATIESRLIPRLAAVVVCEHNVHAFRRNNKDGDGMLTYGEFLKGLQAIGELSVDDFDEKQWIIEKVDPTKAGWVTYKAFNKLCLWAKGKHLKRQTRAGRVVNRRQSTSSTVRPNSRPGSRNSGLEAMRAAKIPPHLLDNTEEILTRYKKRISEITYRRSKLEEELEEVKLELEGSFLEQSKQIQLDNEAKANQKALEYNYSERMGASYGFYARPHIEYPMANLRKSEQLCDDLQKWRNELQASILHLWQQQNHLEDEMQAEIHNDILRREILRNQFEEPALRLQEKTERARAEAQRVKEEKAALEKKRKEEARYREKQRLERRRNARKRELERRVAATKIVSFLKGVYARKTTGRLRDVRSKIQDIFSKSIYFSKNERRLSQRPSPILVLATSDRAEGVKTGLLAMMPGGFWTITERLGRNTLRENIQAALDRSPGVILDLPGYDSGMTSELALGLQCALENIEPRPLVISIAPSEEKVSPPLLKDIQAILDSIREACKLCHPKHLAELKSIGRAPAIHEGMLLILKALQVVRQQNAELTWQQACDILAAPQELFGQIASVTTEDQCLGIGKTKQLVELLGHVHWGTFSFAISPAVHMLGLWVRTLALKNALLLQKQDMIQTWRPESDLTSPLIDICVGQKPIDQAVDIIVQISLYELRLFQNNGLKQMTMFRYGSGHVICRAIHDSSCYYRVYDCQQLAERLIWDWENEIRPHELIKKLCITNKHRFNPIHTVPCTVESSSMKFPDPDHPPSVIDAGALLNCGHENNLVWVYTSPKANRVQVKLLLCQVPFKELRTVTTIQSQNDIGTATLFHNIVRNCKVSADHTTLVLDGETGLNCDLN